MLIEDLQELQDKGSLVGADSNKVRLLLQAINDWPEKVATAEKFLIQVKRCLRIEFLAYDHVRNALTELNPGNSAWEIESISRLLELLETLQGVPVK